MKILFIGDTHGQWAILNHIIKHVVSEEKIELIIQLGDFGFWPTLKNIKKGTYGLGLIDTQGVPLYWIAGNHEHWDHLDMNITKGNYDEIIHVYGDIYYIPRGAVFELSGKIFMGIGGALSIDKINRTEGVSWFKRETPNYQDISRILAKDLKLDYLITHTIPDSGVKYVLDEFKKNYGDPTSTFLEEVVDKFKPTYMYCGHWHERKSFTVHETEVNVLSNVDYIDSNRIKKGIYNDDCYKIVEI